MQCKPGFGRSVTHVHSSWLNTESGGVGPFTHVDTNLKKKELDNCMCICSFFVETFRYNYLRGNLMRSSRIKPLPAFRILPYCDQCSDKDWLRVKLDITDNIHFLLLLPCPPCQAHSFFIAQSNFWRKPLFASTMTDHKTKPSLFTKCTAISCVDSQMSFII